MCQRSSGHEEDVLPKNDPNVSNSARSQPQMLQFVSIGAGGSVSHPNIVRSHAIKGYHQRRKEAKKAYLQSLDKQRNVQLRPIGIAPRIQDVTESERRSSVVPIARTGKGQAQARSSVPGAVGEAETVRDAAEEEIIRQEDLQLCLLTSVPNRGNNCEI